MQGRTRPITEPTYLLLLKKQSYCHNDNRHIEPKISIFSAKHTALTLVAMCLDTTADAFDTEIAG